MLSSSNSSVPMIFASKPFRNFYFIIFYPATWVNISQHLFVPQAYYEIIYFVNFHPFQLHIMPSGTVPVSCIHCSKDLHVEKFVGLKAVSFLHQHIKKCIFGAATVNCDICAVGFDKQFSFPLGKLARSKLCITYIAYE